VGGKFLLCRLEDAKPHPFRIALPFLVSPRLGQLANPIDAQGSLWKRPDGVTSSGLYHAKRRK
jgi:hypothetical protein